MPCEMVWPFFTTYSIDFDVDLADLRVMRPRGRRDLILDVPEFHRAIGSCDCRSDQPIFLVTIGGEHSLAHPLLRASGQSGVHRIGLICSMPTWILRRGSTVLTMEHPFARILEDGIVDPRNLVQIGIAGFVQAEWHARWGRDRESLSSRPWT